MSKKAMSFRLSDGARARLAELAVETKQSATAVVEGLILSAPHVSGRAQDLADADGPRAIRTHVMVKGKKVRTTEASKLQSVVRRRSVPKPGWKK